MAIYRNYFDVFNVLRFVNRKKKMASFARICTKNKKNFTFSRIQHRLNYQFLLDNSKTINFKYLQQSIVSVLWVKL